MTGDCNVESTCLGAAVVVGDGNTRDRRRTPPLVGSRPRSGRPGRSEEDDVRLEATLAMRHEQGQFSDAGPRTGTARMSEHDEGSAAMVALDRGTGGPACGNRPRFLRPGFVIISQEHHPAPGDRDRPQQGRSDPHPRGFPKAHHLATPGPTRGLLACGTDEIGHPCVVRLGLHRLKTVGFARRWKERLASDRRTAGDLLSPLGPRTSIPARLAALHRGRIGRSTSSPRRPPARRSTSSPSPRPTTTVCCPLQSRRNDARVRVHGPRVTVVQRQTRCGSMGTDPDDLGSEASSPAAVAGPGRIPAARYVACSLHRPSCNYRDGCSLGPTGGLIPA
jgi:hypothetical protein